MFILSIPFYFNPRLREGGDVVVVFRSMLEMYFNPRLREGGDVYLLCVQLRLSISIHASEKEATQPYVTCFIWKNFNPRLREGGDSDNVYLTRPTLDFNPRLREGGDPSIVTLPSLDTDFNPRLREGGDVAMRRAPFDG